MRTTERDTDYYHVTEDDNELWCPLMNAPCKAEKCAMAVFTEDREGSNYYCGLVASSKRVAWNEDDEAWLSVPWTKGVTRESL